MAFLPIRWQTLSQSKQRRFQIQKQAASPGRRLRFEPLEDRRLLAIYTVTNLTDDFVSQIPAPGTLRRAISDANATLEADSIVFQPDLSGTLLLTFERLTITRSLTINGPGADVITIDARGTDPTPNENNGDGTRVFSIT